MTGQHDGRAATTGPHVFVPALDPSGSTAPLTIDGEAGHHLATVLRVRTGDPVSLADDTGLVVQASVTDRTRDTVTATPTAHHHVTAHAVRLTLVQALPKGRKMEEVIQHATEVGVDRVIPVVTARCVKQPAGKDDKLLTRWRAIALAAAQQSRRATLPEIAPITPWPPAGLVGVVAWEGAAAPLGSAVADLLRADPGPADLAIAIGPEGGLEAREVDQVEGLIPVSLGGTILRTETAGVVGPALLAEHLREAGTAGWA